MTRLRAATELLLSSVIWGFGFVAAVWALKVMKTSEVLVWRFFIAAGVGALLHSRVGHLRRHRPEGVLERKKEARQGIIAGFLLAGVLLLQTWGLLYTTPTKSGFITSLYVLQIPIILHFFRKIPLRPGVYVNLLFALLGMALLMGWNPFIDGSLWAEVNRGDALTLLCSVFASFHIVYIDWHSKQIKDAFRFNNYQSLGAGLITIPFLVFEIGKQDFAWSPDLFYFTKSYLAWIGVLSLALGSSVLAFYIQIRTQRVLSPTLASLFFLLEGPFALLFSAWLLSEKLGQLQGVGIVIILAACVRQLLWEQSAKNSKTSSGSQSLP